MNFIFKKLISTPKKFFDLLPHDWQEEIAPHWNRYEALSEIYIIEEDNVIIGGGIVFSTCPPDIEYYQKEAQLWFDNGYLYLGFIWIVEEKRNKHLGSYWLNELKNVNPEQKYWLLIEEEHLHRFYLKNGFTLKKMIERDHHQEWLYAFKPLSS